MPEKHPPTVGRILEAATEIFAAAGFNGARMDEIAHRAGVNKAMIYYHIGAKEALYAAVLHDAIGHVADAIAAGITAKAAPEEKLRAYIRAFAGAVEGNPRMGPILLREVASGGQNLPELVVQDFGRIIGIVAAILEEGRRDGVFLSVNPFVVHMMVAGALVLYKASGPIRARKENIPAAVKSLDLNISAGVIAEVERLILQGVKRTTPDPAGGTRS